MASLAFEGGSFFDVTQEEKGIIEALGVRVAATESSALPQATNHFADAQSEATSALSTSSCQGTHDSKPVAKQVEQLVLASSATPATFHAPIAELLALAKSRVANAWRVSTGSLLLAPGTWADGSKQTMGELLQDLHSAAGADAVQVALRAAMTSLQQQFLPSLLAPGAAVTVHRSELQIQPSTTEQSGVPALSNTAEQLQEVHAFVRGALTQGAGSEVVAAVEGALSHVWGGDDGTAPPAWLLRQLASLPRVEGVPDSELVPLLAAWQACEARWQPRSGGTWLARLGAPCAGSAGKLLGLVLRGRCAAAYQETYTPAATLHAIPVHLSAPDSIVAAATPCQVTAVRRFEESPPGDEASLAEAAAQGGWAVGGKWALPLANPSMLRLSAVTVSTAALVCAQQIYTSVAGALQRVESDAACTALVHSAQGCALVCKAFVNPAAGPARALRACADLGFVQHHFAVACGWLASGALPPAAQEAAGLAPAVLEQLRTKHSSALKVALEGSMTAVSSAVTQQADATAALGAMLATARKAAPGFAQHCPPAVAGGALVHIMAHGYQILSSTFQVTLKDLPLAVQRAHEADVAAWVDDAKLLPPASAFLPAAEGS